MPGDQQAVHAEIETPLPLVLRGVPKKDTLTRARGELMGSSGRGVWVAGAPEDPQVGVGGSGTEKARCGEGAEMTLVGRRLRR
jgi:hypothetical protein